MALTKKTLESNAPRKEFKLFRIDTEKANEEGSKLLNLGYTIVSVQAIESLGFEKVIIAAWREV